MTQVIFFVVLLASICNATFHQGISPQPQSRSMGEKVHGQYSYVDPLGSLIVVKYSTNPDGSDFVEKREMNLNYRKKSTNEQNKFGDSIVEVDGFEAKSDIKLGKLFRKDQDEDTSGNLVDFIPSGYLEKVEHFFAKRYEKSGKILGNLICGFLSIANEREIEKEEDLIAKIFNKTLEMFIGESEPTFSFSISSDSDDTTESSSEVTTTPSETESQESDSAIESDLWSLLQIYLYEAFCSEEKMLESQSKTIESQVEESKPIFDSRFDSQAPPNPDLSMKVVNELKPIINSTVSRMMKLIASATPIDDEFLIGNIQVQLQPFITPKLSKSDLTIEELNLKLDEVNEMVRAVIVEQIHNYRLLRQKLPLAESKTSDSAIWSNQDLDEQEKFPVQDQKWLPSENIPQADNSPRGFFSRDSTTRVKPPPTYTYSYRSGSG